MILVCNVSYIQFHLERIVLKLKTLNLFFNAIQIGFAVYYKTKRNMDRNIDK